MPKRSHGVNSLAPAICGLATASATFLAAASALASGTLYANTTQQIVSAFTTANNDPTGSYTLFIAPKTYTLTTPLQYTQTTGSLAVRGCNNPNPSAQNCKSQDLSNPGNYTISGGDISGLLVTKSGNLSIWGLSLSHGGYPKMAFAGPSPIQIQGSALVQLEFDQITSNHANQFGGAISITGGGVLVSYTRFESNFNDQWIPPMTYEGATSFGGAISVTGGVLTMYEDSFSSNTAGGGGAIFVGGSANLSVTNSTFANNEVATAGGAIFVESFTGVSGPSINLAFNTITNNTAGDSRQGSNIQNFGGGLGFFDFTGYLQTAGNVIAKNTVTQNPNHWNSTDCFADASNFSADAYPNVVGDVTGCLALQGDDGFYGTAASPFDPKLGSGAFLPVQYPGAGIQLFAVKPSAGSPLLASYQSDSVDCAISPSFDCPPVADELDQSRKKAKNGQADYGAIESTGH